MTNKNNNNNNNINNDHNNNIISNGPHNHIPYLIYCVHILWHVNEIKRQTQINIIHK